MQGIRTDDGEQTGVTKELMARYYGEVFPVQRMFDWLGHGDADYASRREWCFTLIGDIFTRYRTHLDANELKRQLIMNAPEKIDIGAVYNIPSRLRHQAAIIPKERELVFDIDMSDYDAVRSCCKGKQICRSCWPWMATAAKILCNLCYEDFGFNHIMPVFSGRRGLHLWICDHRARVLTDEERNAIAHYMSVFAKDGNINITKAVMRDQLHPALERVHDDFLVPGFAHLFLNSQNPNCVLTNPGPAVIARATFQAILAQANSNIPEFSRNQQERIFGPQGTIFHLVALEQILNTEVKVLPYHIKDFGTRVVKCIRFQLMYPRLDIDVTTKRNHLLKAPFCIHPATQKLCVPVTLDTVDSFDPDEAPRLQALLAAGKIDAHWLEPLDKLMAALSEEDAAEHLHAFKPKLQGLQEMNGLLKKLKPEIKGETGFKQEGTS